ncbi:MAG: aminotransferase class I/II-fold pyridoxal phosphate-dependent enzyme [Thermoguttaceae bacterium]|nr:aminotransferase class I/II-fold pyridoxal phosphate-dependent enzyme [Thermoguttaceae bacterium]MDW8039065.1 aminotransferase class I/II-fold pyridoxal phosphate-dependent enzyme [Thermoguttaceae bacterium]
MSQHDPSGGVQVSQTASGTQLTSLSGQPMPIRYLPPGSQLRPLAQELNEIIQKENPHLYEMFSALGRRLYFPKGILAQSAEAKEKAHRCDATIGIARQEGHAMGLDSVMQYFSGLQADEVLPYAPALGLPELRKKWRDGLLRKNPSLQGKSFSTPIVTSGVTHALSLAADLFVEAGDVVLVPDKFWENYELLFSIRYQAQLVLYPFFNSAGGFCLEGLRQALASQAHKPKTILIFNFPNNPTGYSITQREAAEIEALLAETAAAGRNLLVLTDDAYFGLFYQEDVYRESLFARLAGLHPRLVAIKVDGPTKEEFVWGFRIGMLTFSAWAAQSPPTLYGALEKKVAGAIRSAISNCSHPAQTILAKALADPATDAQRHAKQQILQARAHRVAQILRNPKFASYWEPYPFNSGYFMCLRLKGLDAESYRQHLLLQHGIGVIADGTADIRFAFSGLDEDQIEGVFETMAQAAQELLDKKAS